MWNEKKYNETKLKCEQSLRERTMSLPEWMQEYKLMVIKENYEAAKAITDVLKPFNYETSDTHQHIKELNKKEIL